MLEKTNCLVGRTGDVIDTCRARVGRDRSLEHQLPCDRRCKRTRLSDLNIKLNPQLGLSSFEYSGKNSGQAQQKLSGGLTFEFGDSPRKLETACSFCKLKETPCSRSP